jgi:hypothetical protein
MIDVLAFNKRVKELRESAKIVHAVCESMMKEVVSNHDFTRTEKNLQNIRGCINTIRGYAFEFERLQEIVFGNFFYFAYLRFPRIMCAPIERWRSLLKAALKDVDDAQRMLHSIEVYQG